MSNVLDTDATIVAIATPIGVGGISIVRVSGKDAIKIADNLFLSLKGESVSSFNSRELVLGFFNGKLIKDKCLAVVFRAPFSYTGDDVVEFHCHGGIKVTELIVKEVIENGARLAKNGEFSMRAFLNGKMSLDEAEGVIDMINAESEAEIRAGFSLVNGSLTKKVEEFQKKIVDVISEIEVSFDYPEEDIEYATKGLIKSRLTEVLREIEELNLTSQTGGIIKNGINAVIVGKPNVGKSSLLNAIIGRNKAIVTSIAGTTRDVIEDAFQVNGVKVNIIDTAGIRETKDIIERMGVEKSKEHINGADIILFVIDNSEPLSSEDKEIYNLIKDKKHIVIANKTDLKSREDYSKFDENIIFVSAKNNDKINELKLKIYDMVIDSSVIANNIILTNVRHRDALNKARDAIINALVNLENETLDLISIDLNEAYEAIGEITGTSSNEEILDSIFSKFCLGK